MPDRFTPQELVSIPLVLSRPRFATYLRECNNNTMNALRLYHWNAQISASLLFPLHIFEICIRNAVANVADTFYRANWPWTRAFEMSLPDPRRPIFSPRRELINVRGRHATTGKIIADMRFAFWVSMFTARHEGRLWTPYLTREFPNLPAGASVRDARGRIYQAADQVRELRNRIAHHEPVFRRPLANDYAVMLEIVGYRCSHTAKWMDRSQTVTGNLALRP